MLKFQIRIPYLAFLFVASLMVCAALNVQAQSPQTFVSARIGVDVGSCTLAGPCRTVSYAITQLQNFGQVLIVDSGDYDSQVSIDRSVTVAAAPGVVAVFSAAVSNGSIFFSAGGPAICSQQGVCHTLVLRGLMFDGQQITHDAVRAGGFRLTVEDCHFSRFEMGIFMNGAGTLNIKRSTFREINHGIFVAPVGINKTVTGTVEDSNFVELRISGINANTNGSNTLRLSVYNSSFSHSGSNAIRSVAAGGAIQFNLEGCHIASSGTGVLSTNGSSVVRVSNSTIVNNTTGLATSFGVLLTRGNNTVEGNNFNGSFTGTFSAQ